MRFNQLPEKDIFDFLKTISDKENLNLEDDIILGIQKLFNSDIRSMINYMQSNQGLLTFTKAINDDIWIALTDKILSKDVKDITGYIDDISRTQNIDKINIIKNYFNYIIRNRPDFISNKLLQIMENILHITDCDDNSFVFYVVYKLIDTL